MIYSLGDKDIATIDLMVSADIPKGNIFRRLLDGILRFFSTIFKKA